MSVILENTSFQPAPVAQSERITILDSLRGIALLGILLMNIPGFGMPEIQSNDPSVFDEKGINYQFWYYIELIFAGTQRALFSLLFGAGMILFVTRQQKRADGLMPAEYFFRRQLWLLVFGLFNAFVLLWFWDILFDYSLYGMLLFAFYRMKPKGLLIAALISLVLMTARENINLYRTKEMISKGEAIAVKDTSSETLTEKEKAAFASMKEFRDNSTKEAKQKAAKKEIEAYKGSYPELYKVASDKSVHVEMYYTYYLLWDVLVFIFLGMAWYKTGVVTGNASTRFYWILFLGGTVPGIFLTWLQMSPAIQNGFNEFETTKKTIVSYYQVSRVLRSVGFFGLMMLLYKSGLFKWFFALLRPVGQMAFTNYLMQSFMCGLFFYGIGFNRFGELQRYELYIVVAVVWVIEIICSHIWLKYFLFGPIEWIWRSLTYWKIQPMRRSHQ
jgi:uncharacterized protein